MLRLKDLWASRLALEPGLSLFGMTEPPLFFVSVASKGVTGSVLQIGAVDGCSWTSCVEGLGPVGGQKQKRQLEAGGTK